SVRPLVSSRLDVRGGAGERSSHGPDQGAAAGAEGRVTFNQLPRQTLVVEARAPGFLTQASTFEPGAARPGDPSSDGRSMTIVLARDPDPPGTGVPWASSLAEAFDRARESSLPVLVAMAMDGETANDELAARHFKDPDVIRVLRTM